MWFSRYLDFLRLFNIFFCQIQSMQISHLFFETFFFLFATKKEVFVSSHGGIKCVFKFIIYFNLDKFFMLCSIMLLESFFDPRVCKKKNIEWFSFDIRHFVHDMDTYMKFSCYYKKFADLLCSDAFS